MPLARSIRRLALLFLLAGARAHAADLPDPWVEVASDGGLDVRAITMPGASCPKVTADGAAVPSVARGQPESSGGAYAVQVLSLIHI